ncbi:DUF3265 domain-containing protein [Vibrio sp. YMD68]|nr:DUF3265 domain-containing protein [Vibrio sp. YMD68]WGV98068.1 DUF3265 domain-containing protein [Vibrio sp. YMD68]
MIPHAWHFWFWSNLVFTVFNFSVVVAWLTP